MRSRYTAVAAPFLVLWGLSVLFGALVQDPILEAIPQATDSDVFRPGGLMLLETFRLGRGEVLLALRRTLVLYVAAATALLMVRGRLLAVVVDASENNQARPDLLSGIPIYLGVSFVHVSFTLVLVFLSLVVASDLPRPDVGMLFERLGAHVALAAAFLFAWMSGSLVFDLLKLALFRRVSIRHCAPLLARTLRARGWRLLGYRTLRLLVTVLSGFATLTVAARPFSGGWPALTLLVGQAMALSVLATETWYYFKACDALLEESAGPEGKAA